MNYGLKKSTYFSPIRTRIEYPTPMSFNPEYSEQSPTAEEVREFSGVTLLEFGAPWCGFCQAAAPLVQKVMEECSGIPHIKIYDGRGKRLGRSFSVKLWPTLIVLKDGAEVTRVVRPENTDEIRQLLNSQK